MIQLACVAASTDWAVQLHHDAWPINAYYWLDTHMHQGFCTLVLFIFFAEIDEMVFLLSDNSVSYEQLITLNNVLSKYIKVCQLTVYCITSVGKEDKMPWSFAHNYSPSLSHAAIYTQKTSTLYYHRYIASPLLFFSITLCVNTE